jgi:glycosyltransferase involved in cell wall biosynthesis
MKIALVSTYPPTRCGIANYAENLRVALRGEGARVHVVAEVEPGTRGGEDDVERSWSRKGPWVRDVLATLEALRPEVVHIQHEESILGQDRRLGALLRGVRELGIASVVTLHSVYGGRLGIPGIRYSPLRFQSELGRLADRIIVHQIDGCQDRLLEQKIDGDKVAVIPHGTTLIELPGRDEARRHLGIDGDSLVVLAIGFIHKKKGLHTLVDAFYSVVDGADRARLFVAGSFRRRPWDLLYNRRLEARMAAAQSRGWLDFREGFHGMDDMLTMLAAADVVALPYRQAYGSASGVLHMALGAGRAVLCADGYKFAEARRAWGDEHPELFPPPGDPSAWADALGKVLRDDELRARLAERAKGLGEETAWSRVAQQHLETFQAAVSAAGN